MGQRNINATETKIIQTEERILSKEDHILSQMKMIKESLAHNQPDSKRSRFAFKKPFGGSTEEYDIAEVKKKLDVVEGKLIGMETKLDTVEIKLVEVESKVDKLEDMMAQLLQVAAGH